MVVLTSVSLSPKLSTSLPTVVSLWLNELFSMTLVVILLVLSVLVSELLFTVVLLLLDPLMLARLLVLLTELTLLNEFELLVL